MTRIDAEQHLQQCLPAPLAALALDRPARLAASSGRLEVRAAGEVRLVDLDAEPGARVGPIHLDAPLVAMLERGADRVHLELRQQRDGTWSRLRVSTDSRGSSLPLELLPRSEQPGAGVEAEVFEQLVARTRVALQSQGVERWLPHGVGLVARDEAPALPTVTVPPSWGVVVRQRADGTARLLTASAQRTHRLRDGLILGLATALALSMTLWPSWGLAMLIGAPLGFFLWHRLERTPQVRVSRDHIEGVEGDLVDRRAIDRFEVRRVAPSAFGESLIERARTRKREESASASHTPPPQARYTVWAVARGGRATPLIYGLDRAAEAEAWCEILCELWPEASLRGLAEQ